jgi:hypothetical protein
MTKTEALSLEPGDVVGLTFDNEEICAVGIVAAVLPRSRCAKVELVGGGYWYSNDLRLLWKREALISILEILEKLRP